MKKLLLVTALSAFSFLSATSAFAQEVPVTASASVSHFQNIHDLKTGIVGTPKAYKRVKRGFSWEGLGKCVTGTLGEAVKTGTAGVIAGAAAGRVAGPQATVAGATIGGVGGVIGGGLSGASDSCF